MYYSSAANKKIIYINYSQIYSRPFLIVLVFLVCDCYNQFKFFKRKDLQANLILQSEVVRQYSILVILSSENIIFTHEYLLLITLFIIPHI